MLEFSIILVAIALFAVARSVWMVALAIRDKK